MSSLGFGCHGAGHDDQQLDGPALYHVVCAPGSLRMRDHSRAHWRCGMEVKELVIGTVVAGLSVRTAERLEALDGDRR